MTSKMHHFFPDGRRRHGRRHPSSTLSTSSIRKRFAGATSSSESDYEKKHKKSGQRQQPFNTTRDDGKKLLKRKSPLDLHGHGETRKGSHAQSSKFFCGICFDENKVSDRFNEGKCKYPFCTDCISKHVATQIRQNILKVMCPNPICSVELKPESLHTILPKEVIVRWECARCESLIVESEKTYCPFKDCSVLLVNDGEEAVTSAECPSCHRLFCALCRVPWHGSMICEEFKRSKRNKYKDEQELNDQFLNLAKKKKWQKCPQCTMFVKRGSGCEHMTCRCGCNFCYMCGKKWTSGHVCKKHRSST